MAVIERGLRLRSPLRKPGKQLNVTDASVEYHIEESVAAEPSSNRRYPEGISSCVRTRTALPWDTFPLSLCINLYKSRRKSQHNGSLMHVLLISDTSMHLLYSFNLYYNR